MAIDGAAPSRVPIFPFRFFRTAIEGLKDATVLPHRIDRSVWGNKHFGITDDDLLPAFRFLYLIDGDDRPCTLLGELVRSFGTDDWPTQVARMLHESYTDVLAIGVDLASPKHILAFFRTRYRLESQQARTATSFFLHACRDARVDLGPFLSATRKAPQMEGKEYATRERAAKLFLDRLPEFNEAWSDDVKLAWLSAYSEILMAR